ncbi:MAG: hypothetical protein HON53_22735 [Planctomycetaceae bacterium]|jgi:hypothetical protein|nr:hypothetical protein [Planctomycetaceae bacterium]MBT6154929.1 hypothetical protein [Planctomycetaceae bacterium]MBT6484508.1 hypothetical protein [Planctomycetaceae bacterium]MBT6492961.1 hypothetical protein [Planctomycetaceae bacterium]
MDQGHHAAFLQEIRNDLAEAAARIKELRELEERVEQYVSEKTRIGQSKVALKPNPRIQERSIMGTVEFDPNGFPAT